MDYKAKQHYQNSDVANQYDDARFKTWAGRLSHKIEANALERAVQTYCTLPGSVLDIPCGTGRLLPVLTGFGLEVTGADISEEMMSVARGKFKNERNVSFRMANAEKLPFADGAFDYLTSYRLFCHLPGPARIAVLSEMARVTRKFLILNYHVSSWSPVYLFSQYFRKSVRLPYPVSLSELLREISAVKSVRLAEVRKLSWYERSSVLMVLKKTGES